ncbi:MAG: hypothetical protein AB7I38_17015 [Dehalococcoidia bacterium]
MADGFRTNVDGLRELARDFREVDPSYAKKLQVANKTVAETIAGRARARYQQQHQSRSGDGANSIRALATQQRAQVAFGSARAPYVPGQEFGSHGGPGKRQFPAYVPSPSGRGGRGYFFFPTLREETEDLPELYLKAIEEVLRPVFPD